MVFFGWEKISEDNREGYVASSDSMIVVSF